MGINTSREATVEELDQLKAEILQTVSTKKSDVKALKQIIQRWKVTPDILNNTKDSDGRTVLHLCVELQRLDFVKYLLSIGCQVRTLSNHMLSPLHAAAAMANSDITAELLEAGGLNAVLCTNFNGDTPLHLAAQSFAADPRAFKLIYDYCTEHELNQKNLSGNTILHIASVQNNSFLLDMLLTHPSKRIYIQEAGEFGVTALHMAVQRGHVESVRILLAHGSDPLFTTSMGLTALHLAFAYEHYECAETVLEYVESRSLTVICADAYGNLPLHYALGHFEPKIYERDNILRKMASTALIERLLQAELTQRIYSHACLSLHHQNKDKVTPMSIIEENPQLKKSLRKYLVEPQEYHCSLQVASDLHLETLKHHTKSEVGIIYQSIVGHNTGADYLALLGDIGTAGDPTLTNFLLDQTDHYKKVFFITGNHEYYSKEVNEADEELRKICELNPKLIFLNRGSYVDGNIRFVGCTLWTFIPKEARKEVQMCMNDYRHIMLSDNEKLRALVVEDTIAFHQKDVAYIKEQIAEAKTLNQKVVVLTHHSPVVYNGCSNPSFWFGESNSAFATDLMDLFDETVVLWAYGHTHWNHDMTFKETRVVANQGGYPLHHKNTAYNPNFVVHL